MCKHNHKDIAVLITARKFYWRGLNSPETGEFSVFESSFKQLN